MIGFPTSTVEEQLTTPSQRSTAFSRRSLLIQMPKWTKVRQITIVNSSTNSSPHADDNSRPHGCIWACTCICVCVCVLPGYGVECLADAHNVTVTQPVKKKKGQGQGGLADMAHSENSSVVRIAIEQVVV
jgi:hypothetical protein